MAELNETTLAPSLADSSHSGSSIMSPEITLMILTWVTFFLLLAVLKKFAWGPILTALDAREKDIQRSVDEAKRIHEEMARLEEISTQMVHKAEESSKTILDEARAAAREASRIIQQKAREESQIMLENARREIKEEQEKAQAVLRKESADLAIDLASKIIEKNLDKNTNKKIINRFLKEL